MGFMMQHQIINGKPVLLEVLHETAQTITSIIITNYKGDKIRSIKCKKSLLDKDLFSKCYEIEDGLKNKSIIAAIPINQGDMLIRTTLHKEKRFIVSWAFRFFFVHRSSVSGATYGASLDDPAGEIQVLRQLEFTQQKNSHDHHSSSDCNPAALIGLFNVLNPQNAISYHSRAVGFDPSDKTEFPFADFECSDSFLLNDDFESDRLDNEPSGISAASEIFFENNLTLSEAAQIDLAMSEDDHLYVLPDDQIEEGAQRLRDSGMPEESVQAWKRGCKPWKPLPR